MTNINYTISTQYSKEQMFDLVCDFEKYPIFLPWCTAAKVLSSNDNTTIARVDLEKGPLKLYWVSKNIENRPDSIQLEYIEGTFKSMQGSWKFLKTPVGSDVSFSLDYKFASKFVELSLNPVLNVLIGAIVRCFSNRADKVYGNG